MLRHKLMAALVIGALVHVTALSEHALAMSAAEKRDEQARAAMKGMEVGRDTRVFVKLRNGKTVVGSLTAVSDRSFLVSDAETHVSTQVPYRNVRQINAMSKGAEEVTATAAVVAAITLIYVACWGRFSSGLCSLWNP